MMTKKHSTKKALMASVLSLLLCFSMLVGTTFAWFTDSVTSANNIIQSGTLDVEMYWAEGKDAVPTTDAGWTDASRGAIFDYDKWEPGYTVVRHIKIANEGSLALKYQLNCFTKHLVGAFASVHQISVQYKPIFTCIKAYFLEQAFPLIKAAVNIPDDDGFHSNQAIYSPL